MFLKIFGVALACLGILVGLCILYLLIVALMPGFPTPRKPLKKISRGGIKAEKHPVPFRETRTFEVNGTPLSASLYLPNDSAGRVPCIIMGHGAGGTQNMLLENYALKFRTAGFAVLTFDYRYYGESGGQPRNLLWIPHQLEDWSAAVRTVRDLKEIDPERIALWGTSLGGGHAIVTASKFPEIACVAAQCPGLDGRASGEVFEKREGIGYLLRMIIHGQRDIVRSWLGLSPHKIPLVGEPGDIALLTTENVFNLFSEMAPDGFANQVCARIILRSGRYRPVNYARNIRCPVLLQICDFDTLTPQSAATLAEKNLGELAKVKHYPVGHFEIYTGEVFEEALNDQLTFFKQHLFKS